MKKLFTIILFFSFTIAFAQVEGTWMVANQAGAIGVGPELGNTSWWSNNEGDLTLRACYFDDKYVFADDGTFSNVQDGSTWVEEWQGSDPPACLAPVAPHDGSNAATWTYSETAGTITLDGVGAYLGLAKVFNGGELTNPGDAPESITYLVAFSNDDNTMTIDIEISGGAYWRYILDREDASSINEVTLQKMKVYPNPATDVIHLENIKGLAEVKVYTMTGQVVYQSQEIVSSIDVSNFPTGIYSISATDIDGQQYISKFMVQ